MITALKTMWWRLLAIGIVAVASGLAAFVIWQARSGSASSSQINPNRIELTAGGLPAIALTQKNLPVSPADAMELNAARQVETTELVPARRFALGPVGRDDPRYGAAVECLTQAIYYEAASEPVSGKRAVAQVILNRVHHPAFPNTVCGVVYQGSSLPTGCQFTFTCDGSLLRIPSRRGWEQARLIAQWALDGGVEPAVGLALNYHADYVVPYWASSLVKLATIGRHIFYGSHGSGRAAFSARYAFAQEAAPNRIELSTIDPDALELTDEAATSASLTPDVAVSNPVRKLAADSAGTLSRAVPTLEADRRSGELLVNRGRMVQESNDGADQTEQTVE